MLMIGKTSNTDLPPIGYCNEFLIGSKYDGAAVSAWLPMNWGSKE